MGTPEFALPTFKRLATFYPLVGAVTQPDRPAGRGRHVVTSPVKSFALAEGIPVFQPERLRRIDAVEYVRAWAPDLIVVAAYGQILPPSLLEIPRFGCVNVHASLLPRWRGAAPIQAALLAGDAVTGVTIMQMDEGLDTGPILAQRQVEIHSNETAGTLEARLADWGGELLMEILPEYFSGDLQPRPQPEEGVTHARSFRKKAAHIDWAQPAEAIRNQIRAFAPEPGAYTSWNGRRFKIFEAQLVKDDGLPEEPPGTIFMVDDSPAVMTGQGALRLGQVQIAGKRPMSGEVFVRGRQEFVGARLGSQRPGERT